MVLDFQRILVVSFLCLSATAQGYPQVTATVKDFQFSGFFGAEALVDLGNSRVRQALPIGANASSGFDLNAVQGGGSARAQFTLGSGPFRAEVRVDVVDPSGGHTTGATAPVELTFVSSQSMSAVLRLSIAPGNLDSSVWLAVPGSPSITLLNQGFTQFRDVPLNLVAGVPARVNFGVTTSTALSSVATNSGSAVLEFASVTASFGANFRPGCPGSAGQPALSPIGGDPILGSAFDLGVNSLPSGAITLGLLGFQNIPTDLGPFGAPGCVVATDIASSSVIANPAGTGIWSLAIPNLPALMSLAFLQQALVLDATANPFGVVVSNCGRGVFGT